MTAIFCGANLLAAAFVDFKTRTVDKRLIYEFMIIGAILSLIEHRFNIFLVISGCIPGLICMFLAWITKEKIGYGDAYILLALGITQGLGMCTLSVLSSFSTLLFVAGVLYLVEKNGRRELPYIPFLFIGWLLNMISFSMLTSALWHLGI